MYQVICYDPGWRGNTAFPVELDDGTEETSSITVATELAEKMQARFPECKYVVEEI